MDTNQTQFCPKNKLLSTLLNIQFTSDNFMTIVNPTHIENIFSVSFNRITNVAILS